MAWFLWQVTRTQALIFGTDNPKKPLVVLNFAAVLPVIQLYVDGREEQRSAFEAVLMCHKIDRSHGVFDYFS
jgi:hypothetical protein